MIQLPDAHDLLALNQVIRQQFGDLISGISARRVRQENSSTLTVHFINPATAADEAAVQAIIDAHDPIFLQAERDGDDVTVTVAKPRNLDNIVELTLTVDNEALPEAVALVDNTATVQIECADEITIGILEDYPHQEVTV